MNKIEYRAFTNRCKGLALQLKSPVEVMVEGKSFKTLALWDTGATKTCISTNVVEILELVPTGKNTIRTPSGSKDVNTYLIDLGLPNGVCITDAQVCDSDIGNQGIDVLVGMDIILHGDFIVTNYNGRTTMSFRIPSKETVDFVQQAIIDNKIQPHGPGKRKRKKR